MPCSEQIEREVLGARSLVGEDGAVGRSEPERGSFAEATRDGHGGRDAPRPRSDDAVDGLHALGPVTERGDQGDAVADVKLGRSREAPRGKRARLPAAGRERRGHHRNAPHARHARGADQHERRGDQRSLAGRNVDGDAVERAVALADARSGAHGPLRIDGQEPRVHLANVSERLLDRLAEPLRQPRDLGVDLRRAHGHALRAHPVVLSRGSPDGGVTVAAHLLEQRQQIAQEGEIERSASRREARPERGDIPGQREVGRDDGHEQGTFRHATVDGRPPGLAAERCRAFALPSTPTTHSAVGNAGFD